MHWVQKMIQEDGKFDLLELTNPSIYFLVCETAAAKVTDKETFKSGGSITMTTGSLVPMSRGGHIKDPTGLGQWKHGVDTQFKESQMYSYPSSLHTEPAQDQLGPRPLAAHSALNTNTDHNNMFLQDYVNK